MFHLNMSKMASQIFVPTKDWHAYTGCAKSFENIPTTYDPTICIYYYLNGIQQLSALPANAQAQIEYLLGLDDTIQIMEDNFVYESQDQD